MNVRHKRNIIAVNKKKKDGQKIKVAQVFGIMSESRIIFYN